jgi:uncharacterized membrane protein
MQPLPLSEANGVSADGSVVVGGGRIIRPWGYEHRACRWTASGGLQDLGELPGMTDGVAWAVSADGSVVVGSCTRQRSDEVPVTSIAFRWDAHTGTMQALGPDTVNTQALGISADGSVVVGAEGVSNDTWWIPVRWDQGGMTVYPLANRYGLALAASGDGSVVVGMDQNGAFRWIGSDVIGLNHGSASATDISVDGSVVVGAFVAGPALVWTTERGAVSLSSFLTSRGVSLGGWWPYGARGVSADGRVVVGVATSGSQERAFVAYLGRGAGLVCGPADFDGDGTPGTDQDIEAFFACLAGNCCASCGADFDGDGDVATDADIEAFFRVLGGGHC